MGTRFPVLHRKFLLFAGVLGASQSFAQDHASSRRAVEKLQASSPDCLSQIPGDMADLLVQVKELNALVVAGKLSPQEAQDVFKQKVETSTKGDPTAVRLAFLLAQDTLAQAQEGKNLQIMDKLTQGQALSPDEQLFVDMYIPPTEIEKIVAATKKHFDKLRSSGITIEKGVVDVSKADPKVLRADKDLQGALDAIYPGVGQKLADGKLVSFGDLYLLPPPRNRFKTQMQLDAEIELTLNRVHADMIIYAQSSIKAASYWDMMRGRLSDRAWWTGNADAPTESEVNRDESYSRINKDLRDLREVYGMSPTQQKPYFDALRQIARKEDEALANTLSNLEKAKWTYLTAPVTLFGLGTLGRGAQIGFLFGVGATAVDAGVLSPALAKMHYGGDYLCHVAKNMTEKLPTGYLLSAVFAPAMALRPLQLYKASGAAANTVNALAAKLPQNIGSKIALQGLTPSGAQTAFKGALVAMGVPGLTYAGFETREAFRAHQAGKAAEVSGNAGLAQQAFAERDESIKNATLGAALSTLPFLGGKAGLKKPAPLLTKAQTLERYASLKNYRVKAYKGKPEAFEKDFKEFVEVRDRTNGTDSKEFLEWWKNKQAFYTSNTYQKALGTKNQTFSQLLEEAGHDFFMEVGRVKGTVWQQKFAWLASPKALLAAVGGAGVGLGHKLGDAVWNAVTLAPAMRLVNAYTDAPIVPLEAYLRQRGNKDLGGVATTIQSWINNQGEAKGHLAEMEAQLVKFRSASNKSTSNSAQEKIWKDFQNYYYKKFLIFNQSLAGNLREGRSFMIGFELMDTSGIMNIMNTRFDAYKNAKHELEDLQIRQNKGEVLDPVLVNRMAELSEDMKRNLDSTATMLAIYKIRQFMYRGDLLNTANPMKGETEVELETTFNAVADAMGYKYFNEQVGGRMEEIFKSYKSVFAIADQQSVTALQAADAKK